ncbi:carbohydrate esterase family 15 protein [Amanita thiersii Skay4041]|uniref:(4-O-methyl)-D-glucuronate--lignin esterase n=1 Tax=Amanita thiersii Skay4041 TaxID=703135 RepID=A0A2A9NEC2_9AGAR|nr:carbohydrate esterase family 15 protein [Amanita thiersii Skay4041]
MIGAALILLASLLPFSQQAPTACPSLPNPLPGFSSLPVISALPNPWAFFDDWQCRKEQIKTLVQEYFYGYYPDHSLETVRAVRSGNTVNITVTANGRTGTFSATLSFPSRASPTNRVPVVINPGLIDTTVFLGSGVALATFNVNTVAADSSSKTGAFWNLYNGRDIGVLTAWAWGYHRIIDALTQVAPEIDLQRIGVTGCSRWGKAALAAGIFDERVTLSIPMSSGIEGVGPWRFFFEQDGANEKIENIYGVFPYWSSSKLGQFTSDAHRLPFDAHFLAILVAPTNPQGEASVTYSAAHAVYQWLGVGDKVGVSVRPGGHCDNSGYSDIRDFMNKIFFNRTTTRDYTSISPYTPYTQAFPWINDAP